MSVPAGSPPSPDIGRLHLSLTDARDEQILRVVALIDDLARRDAADLLIAPFRPRLAQLRPPRRLSFRRLLFVPLEPAIVPATAWRRGDVAIPRTALRPIADQLWASLGRDRSAIRAGLDSPSLDEQDAFARTGAIAWAASAALLRHAPVPSDWPAVTGLGAVDHAALTGAIADVLDAAEEIETLVACVASGDAADPSALSAALAASGRDGAALLLRVLLERLPPGSLALDLAARIAGSDAGARIALDRALDSLLRDMHAPLDGSAELSHAGEQVLRWAALLDGIETPGPHHRPTRKSEAETLRRQIDQTCRSRFARDLASRVTTPGAELTADVSAADIAAIEDAARQLRAFEGAGARIGGAAAYDALLRSAADTLAGSAAPLADRVRLIEILVGSDAALARLGTTLRRDAEVERD